MTFNVYTYIFVPSYIIRMKLEEEIKQEKFNSEYHKLSINIIFTHSWLSYQQQSFFKKSNITPQQFNVLRILRGQHPKPATVNLLIERMIDKSSNASRIVDKLEAKGWVKRTTCPQDRRAVDVQITADGMELLKKMDRYEQEWEKGLHTLTLEEATQLNSLLDKLRG